MRPDDAGRQKRLEQRVSGAGVAQKGPVKQREHLSALLDPYMVERGLQRKIGSQIFKTCGIHVRGLLQC